MGELTPMMEQYQSIKKEYADYILLYRLGDFYETFGEDAALAARELDIVLTSRGRGDERVPMAGIPYHAAESYIARLIKKGHKVAICEQMEDPSLAKGLVRREVVRVITPGTVLEDSMLEKKAGNYLAAVSCSERGFGLSAVEVSTGEFVTMELAGEDALLRLLGELSRLRPPECLLPPALFKDKRFTEQLRSLSEMALVRMDEEAFDPGAAGKRIMDYFEVASLDGFGCAGKELAISAAGAVLSYLDRIRKGADFCIDALRTQTPGEHLVLDSVTQRNLELVLSLRDGSAKGTLLEVLDSTVTAMGGRLLRRWVLQPLTDVAKIRTRLGAVRELLSSTVLSQSARALLRGVHDIERLTGRVTFGSASPRDLLALASSLRVAGELKRLTASASSEGLRRISGAIDPLEPLSSLIAAAIPPDAPSSTREGGFIQEGYNSELDALVASTREARDWLAGLEAKERERTGIRSLKVGFNRVFGYYIEVTKPNLGMVPPDYIRKQTIAGGERFVTEELQRYEDQVLSAEERIRAMEQRLFSELLERASLQAPSALATARALAELDALLSLAEAAARNGYCEPDVDDGDAISIKDGRHPVVERMLPPGTFVPNDTHLDCSGEQMMILTGPNMAGKSTYMRQVALIVIMAQMGSFVPARRARVGVVDRVFTRVGAADDLVRGQSTFMVEMIETASILNSVTRRSLVLLDEIGRGTSTYDGMSIAWAVAEHLHNEPRAGCKTLFATHYHQLTDLTRSLPRARNYHMPVKEAGDEIVFLRRVLPGSVDRSYGIQVARLAGLPRKVTERARAVLSSLEAGGTPLRGRATVQTTLLPLSPPPDPIVEELRGLDVENMSPMEALLKLHELWKRAGPAQRASPQLRRGGA
ncbi:MAG: DNA mismatch repair protein MutS [Thermoplasmatota archaeon]